MLILRIEMMGDVVLNRALSRFGESIQDFTPVFQQIRENFAVIEAEQFQSQGGRSGAPWPPLSPDYAAWKNKYFPGRSIMQLTLALWGELTGGAGLMVEMAPKHMRLTVGAPYAIYHQQGLGNNPMRKLVHLTEADKMTWMKFVHNFIYDKDKEAHLL
jgi:hypothetical protein